jgi:hypothetical protein
MSRLPQIIAAQLALALVIAGLAAGLAWAIPALVLASFILVLATGRLRRRWTYEWLAHGWRYIARQRTLPAGADAATPEINSWIRMDG